MDDSWTLDLSEPDVAGRVLAASGGLVSLYGFWELVLRPWPAVLAPGGWPTALPGLVTLGLGLILLGAACIGPPQSITVDPQRRVVLVTARLPVIGIVRRRIPFARIATVTVADQDDSDSPRPLRLCLIQHGPRWPLCVVARPAARRAEIEAMAARLRASLQHASRQPR
jgi:hypothetical protein